MLFDSGGAKSAGAKKGDFRLARHLYRRSHDSSLEENGFEPSVPRSMESTSGAKSGQPAPKHMSGGISRKQSDQACSANRA
jgi:hypothetical protein